MNGVFLLLWRLQVSLNSSSNSSLPLLWQLPINFKSRKKRDVLDGILDFDEYNDEDNKINDAFSSSMSSFHLGKVATRLKNGMVLYALMDSDPQCRKVLHF